MPRKSKKQTKTKEEKLASEFFPVDKEDIKYAVEKLYKRPDLSSLIKIEKQGKKPVKKKVRKTTKKKTTKRKSVKKTAKKSKKEFKIPKIKLKKEGYELIITEKPQAATKIAQALGKSTKRTDKGVSYYEVARNGKKIIVACAVGHLFTLAQKTTGSEVPKFDITWVPNYYVRKKDFSKKYYDVLSKLAKGAGELTVATDYDVEGEVIGWNVVRFVTGQPDASRMKFSTLTDKELNQAYESKSKTLDWGQAIAGETRHFLDWFYGINLSRALMNAIKTTGKFRVMSIGRVQGPALELIVQKERLISAFKSQKYWQIFITLEEPEIELIHNKDIFKKTELSKFKELIGKTGEAETKKSSQTLKPNPPFNLTTLQTEAYRLFGITPSKTLQIAQSLYLSGLISYPRTSSQKLPPSIGYKEILKALATRYKLEKLLKRSSPIEGKKSDPAHPSIYPTGNFQILSGDEKKVYELIVKRFLCLFMEDAIIENKKIKVDINGLIFTKKGSEIKKKSWLEIYPKKISEQEIPDVNGEVKIKDSRTEEKETQPPKRYSPASILSELEKRNLGTKATRANILETLYDRGYVKGQSIEATPLGMSLIETMEKHSPIIIDEKLTREFEKDMESIQQAKKNQKEKEEKTLSKAKSAIEKIAKQFEKEEKEIGRELLQANEELREQQREENKLNSCPVCKKGHLKITYSKKTRRYFVACDAYPDCKNTYSLPPNGSIKKTDKTCEHCDFPMLMRLSKGKRPWIFCFNPDCPTNKERIEKYKNSRNQYHNS
jgi:DNA topoisomerase-1